MKKLGYNAILEFKISKAMEWQAPKTEWRPL